MLIFLRGFSVARTIVIRRGFDQISEAIDCALPVEFLLRFGLDIGGRPVGFEFELMTKPSLLVANGSFLAYCRGR